MDVLERVEAGNRRRVARRLGSAQVCLFAEPIHAYVGRPIRLEAVLANEDVLAPGSYRHIQNLRTGWRGLERKPKS